MTDLTRHIRRPTPAPRNGAWRIACDCGWKAEIPAAGRDGILTGTEAAAALEEAFRAHLPPDQRRLYILVDQRPGHVGNWIMPEGSPVQISQWIEDEGTYRGLIGGDNWLPIGEIRTAEGRVFRME